MAPNLTGQDKVAKETSKLHSTHNDFMMQQKTMLVEYSTRINNPQDEHKEQKDAIVANF